MDMGYKAELAFFCQAAGNSSHYEELFKSFAASARATLKAAEAMQTGQIVGIG